MRTFLLVLSLWIGGHAGYTQSAQYQHIDDIIEALYAVISGPAGAPRDEQKFKDLFVPDAQLRTQYEDSLGNRKIAVMTVDAFWAGMSKYTADHGFFERELARRTEHWDGIAHVWSSCESFDSEDNPNPFDRGINSIQLFFDGKRWWVVSIYWQSEMDDVFLPKSYKKRIK